ncbi:FAD binding domain-containing protein [Apiospora saccharicola]|uniref:FAD binding domain-containing protein n=1 Tax=Apiospora saccharicola TaxID=335842 RepID=A0ABR1UP43_9PEZI
MGPQKTSYADLLIIGAGPAGLVAAYWASEYGLDARVIDDKPDRVTKGHADGITCRTMEMFDSFGIAGQVYEEAALDYQIRYWRLNAVGRLDRAQSINSQAAGICRFQQCLLSQGRIEELLEDRISRGKGRLRVERDVETLRLTLHQRDDPDASAETHPVQVNVRHGRSGGGCMGDGDDDDHVEETIRARYVIGADGAHSWTRRQLGLTMRGEQANHVWGVVDLVAVTDFPDIRQTCVVCSEHGNLHVVPRERGMVRLYVQLDDDGVNPSAAAELRSEATLETILATAGKALRPFLLECARLDWWSVYQVGQRIADRFSAGECVFLVGDAIHTHSPKVGQGMNVSMQDSYNLGWKLGGVLKGQLQSHVLETYETERRPVAESLIAVDQETVAFYAARGENVATRDLQCFRERHYAFLSGVAIQYEGSALVYAPSAIELATGIQLGRRMPSYRVINYADARPTELASKLASDRRWAVILFAGDLRQATQLKRLEEACAALLRSRLLRTRGSSKLVTITASPRDSLPLTGLPPLLYCRDGENDGHGQENRNYEVVFSDEPDVYGAFTDVYAKYGVDREKGCLVVCRPDQHVGFIGALEDVPGLDVFFTGIFRDS